MGLENIRIVLARPLYGGNVGSVCRAMMNMGLADLALVPSRKNLDEEELRKMALGAVRLYEGRTEHPTVADAVADCGLVAGTSARTGFYRSHAKTAREWAPHLLQASEADRVALVFGPEDTGLHTDELALCTQIIQIPSTDAYTSLNLSHAVMVCCYELYVASGLFEPAEEASPEAPSALRERMFEMWRHMLFDTGFMKEDKAKHMMLGVRRILSRGTLTEADVQILMGIARQMRWFAQRYGPSSGAIGERRAPPPDEI
jgi:tRNA/rRNA methyltransferase